MASSDLGKFFFAAHVGDLSSVEAGLSAGIAVHTTDDTGDSALHIAAQAGHAQVVLRLLEAGARLEQRGSADYTPLMSAAFAGQLEVVQILLDRGALVGDDLLAGVQTKVNILRESAESGLVEADTVDAWEAFQSDLLGARLRHDLPGLIANLQDPRLDAQVAAVDRLAAAARRGIDVASAVPRLAEFVGHANGDVRYWSSEALSCHAVRAQEWVRIAALLGSEDNDVRSGALSVSAAAARQGVDLAPLIPEYVRLLAHPALNTRHDAAVTLGFLATRRSDVTPAIPGLMKLLDEASPLLRKIGAWALYRVGRHAADIGAAVPALQRLVADPDPETAELARAAVESVRVRERA